MITSDLKEINISDLESYEGATGNILVEVSKGVWKKCLFDPSRVETVVDGVLAIKGNEIVSIAPALLTQKQINSLTAKNKSDSLSKKPASIHKKAQFKHKVNKGKKNDNK